MHTFAIFLSVMIHADTASADNRAEQYDAALDAVSVSECSTDQECNDALAKELEVRGWTREQIEEVLD